MLIVITMVALIAQIIKFLIYFLHTASLVNTYSDKDALHAHNLNVWNVLNHNFFIKISGIIKANNNSNLAHAKIVAIFLVKIAFSVIQHFVMNA